MTSPLVNHAIQSALSQNWKDAVFYNQQLLSENAEDVAAMSRLGYAYLKSGELSQAKSTYRKVLKIDKYNPIAQKNLKLLENLTQNDIHHDRDSAPSPTIFIEEPGKTKTIGLVNPAPFRVLCNVMTAQKVNLTPKRHTIEIRDSRGNYLGALPDDLSFRLHQLIDSGNTYDAYVKSIQKSTISVFVIEKSRGKKFADVPSFSLSNSISSPVKPAAVSEESEEETPEEE